MWGTQLFDSTTQIMSNDYDQGGFRLDHYFGNDDRFFARYATSHLDELDPLQIAGAGVPGFPVADSIMTNSFTIADVHSYSSSIVQTARLAFFRNSFTTGAAQIHTPGSSLSFTYSPTLAANAGVPYFIISGYASVGNPITGPQITHQNDYQGSSPLL